MLFWTKIEQVLRVSVYCIGYVIAKCKLWYRNKQKNRNASGFDSIGDGNKKGTICVVTVFSLSPLFLHKNIK